MGIPKATFGRTGHESTRAIFGGAALGASSEADADRAFDTIVKAGVNHIDVAAGLLTVPSYCTSVTGPIRPIMPGASTDSSAVCPKSVCPLVTVSKLVPSLLISAISPADDDDERPRTATMAATPIAIPSADKPARSFRVRKPTLASRARSRGRSRAGTSTTGRWPPTPATATPEPRHRRRPRGRSWRWHPSCRSGRCRRGRAHRAAR